ncbi:GNAT family N-acetyltransferase [Herbaspirillum sp. meg3]|uniref:GNAT family N-acetyltransferase n=1 Tax=Herbaspirillum sp. meg3 TaxID=2025949 RepID=UPI000B97D1CC|nr:GNAT family N-acetyltransferase [Herbaspirillum sp. meg3]ASU39225.1 GNAT family N-acetyltransferase [Herbaspirillum sp. meg3]
MQIRPPHIDDIDIICRHREEMFREAGRDDKTLAEMTSAFRVWLRPRLLDGSYYGFFAIDNDQVVAGIGLMSIDWPPHPSHPEQDKRGYVLNVYVEPSHRKMGIAKMLMRLAEEAFAARGLQFAILHATQMGRELYAGMGWAQTSEMAKVLK